MNPVAQKDTSSTSENLTATRSVAWTCRQYHFAASHRLVNRKFTEEQNRAFYGKCTNPNGHGHNFILEVAVEGEVDPLTGSAFSSTQLDAVIEEKIVERFDHKNFNLDLPEFTGQVTTGENIMHVMWNILSVALPLNSLKRITLSMSPSNSFEYYGQD